MKAGKTGTRSADSAVDRETKPETFAASNSGSSRESSGIVNESRELMLEMWEVRGNSLQDFTRTGRARCHFG